MELTRVIGLMLNVNIIDHMTSVFQTQNEMQDLLLKKCHEENTQKNR